MTDAKYATARKLLKFENVVHLRHSHSVINEHLLALQELSVDVELLCPLQYRPETGSATKTTMGDPLRVCRSHVSVDLRPTREVHDQSMARSIIRTTL